MVCLNCWATRGIELLEEIVATLRTAKPLLHRVRQAFRPRARRLLPPLQDPHHLGCWVEKALRQASCRQVAHPDLLPKIEEPIRPSKTLLGSSGLVLGLVFVAGGLTWSAKPSELRASTMTVMSLPLDDEGLWLRAVEAAVEPANTKRLEFVRPTASWQCLRPEIGRADHRDRPEVVVLGRPLPGVRRTKGALALDDGSRPQIRHLL